MKADFDSQFHHGRKGMAALQTVSVVRKQTADREWARLENFKVLLLAYFLHQGSTS